MGNRCAAHSTSYSVTATKLQNISVYVHGNTATAAAAVDVVADAAAAASISGVAAVSAGTVQNDDGDRNHDDYRGYES